MEKTVLGIILALFIINMIGVAVNIQSAKAKWTGTVYIRADGSIYPPDAPIITYDNITYTLTDNITSLGDGIVIERSNIVVNGNGFRVLGPGPGPGTLGINITKLENVTITNATIMNFATAIRLQFSNYNTISANNIIANSWHGIEIYNSHENKISNNNIINNNVTGIQLVNSAWNQISNNNISGSWGNPYWGIKGCGIEIGIIFYSHNNYVHGNRITDNTVGIDVDGAYTTVIENSISNNDHGILIKGPSNYVYSNIIASCAETGITVNGSNNKITNNTLTSNGRGVYICQSSGNTISRNNITDNNWGIYLFNCSDNVIVENNMIDNGGGVNLESSSHNILDSNYIGFKSIEGGIYGIYLDSGNYPGSCSYNTITRNTITRIKEVGAITLKLSSNNVIQQNFIAEGHGVWLWWGSENNTIIQNSINMSAPEGYYWHMEISTSSWNKFYYNNFIADKDQISIYESTNIWDNGYPGGGNYWSNYTGVDNFSGPYQDQFGSDGIGDAPYIIDKNNKDRYPLMKPLRSPPPDYPLAEWMESPNYTPTEERSITYIVIHVMNGNFEGTISWFQNPDSQVSAHYLVSQEGEIVQMVREKDVAWHAGNWEYNQHSIGIEHEDKGNWDKPNWATEELYQASAALVRYLCDKYGIPKDRNHIIGHSEVPGVAKPCPGPYWDWDYFMGLINGVPAPRKFWPVWEGTVYADYPVLILSNSTVSDFTFNQALRQINFNLTGPSGAKGFCNITIPKGLLKDNPWTIRINGVPITDFSKTENDTHTFIYFTYTHTSTLQVTIEGTWVIPEFPTHLTMFALIMLTTISLILIKKKDHRKLNINWL